MNIILFCLLISSVSGVLMFRDGETEERRNFTELLQNNNVTKLELTQGIFTDRCPFNESEHKIANDKFCPELFHCLPFKGGLLVVCRERQGRYPNGTYPVIDNTTKALDVRICPKDTYQPEFYFSNDFGIICKAAGITANNQVTSNIVNIPSNAPTSTTTSIAVTTAGITANSQVTSNVVNIPSNAPTSTTTSTDLLDSNVGEICGIVAGVLVVFILGVFSVFYFIKWKRRQRVKRSDTSANTDVELGEQNVTENIHQVDQNVNVFRAPVQETNQEESIPLSPSRQSSIGCNDITDFEDIAAYPTSTIPLIKSSVS